MFIKTIIIVKMRKDLCLLMVGLFSLFASCGSVTRWNVMPTPAIHQYLGGEVFESMQDEEKSPNIEVFYATNRPTKGVASERGYGNGMVNELSLGKAQVRMGGEWMDWEILRELSIVKDRKGKIPMRLDSVTELSKLSKGGAEEFAQAINSTLAKREDKQLVIYVHGAKSSFFRSCVQGAQFYHFIRREGVLISFAWPSTGSFLGYKKDVDFAELSAASFADLIEFLSSYTKAEKINILAYSAGAQVIAPALALLRERNPDVSELDLQRKFRLGTVYLAAPDVSLVKFTNTYLPAFQDIVENTTVSYHRKDNVLAWAASANRESRLGRPADGELSEQDIAFLEQASRRGQLDAIDMQYCPDKRPLDFRSHGHWYNNEWVSSDVILRFLYHPRPDERGLKRVPDSFSWYFPLDYPDSLERLLEQIE